MAEFNLFGVFGGVTNWISNIWIVFLIIVALVLLFILLLLWNRHNKLMFPAWEIISFGNGKIGLNKLKVGRFSKKRVFFKLIELPADKDFYTSDHRPVQCASTEDCQKEVKLDNSLHIIDGKQGFLLKRKDGDPKILAPIDKVEIDNYDLIASIAPGDYRDTGSRLYKEAKNEMRGNWEKVAPLVIGGVIFILCFVALIISIQSSSTQLEESRKLWREVFATRNVQTPVSTAP